MAYTTVSARLSFPQPRRFAYAGELIGSLLSIVDKIEKKINPTGVDDDVALERDPRVGPLTIDEVLDKSRRAQ